MYEDAERNAVQHCQQGNIDGLEVLYNRYKDQILRTCMHILGSPSLAEDATQEIFLQVYDKIHHFNGSSAFSTWLYRLSVNHALDLLRKESRHKKILGNKCRPARESNTPEDILIHQEYADKVHLTLLSLSPEYRTVLTLREIEGLNYRDISDILQIPIGTVMSRLSRARNEFEILWIKNRQNDME